ncbi:guanylate kinase 1 [Polychytrium aggregatum]|uniref:guanylate kinase 1 n=1 Tax=Polychytrium aggregatum TaxID=110093 RepID=UPI0022FE7A06|nr:guanylate kinase 1 [Polychytrium aggregatum]KAI9206908.1 guanylate kinase 1 [Polychytrium aggregatum]
MSGVRALMVVSGPSGSGKSTLLNMLFKNYPSTFGFSVSHTTRGPRPGEEDGKAYHFTTRENFQAMVSQNQFIEYAEFSGNMYGTSIAAVEAISHAGTICVLDLEIAGVQSIKRLSKPAHYIFIQPPSIEALERRLRDRKTESEETLQTRLATAKAAMDYAAEPGVYDCIVVNDAVDEAYARLEEFVQKTWNLQPHGSEKSKSKTCNAL